LSPPCKTRSPQVASTARLLRNVLATVHKDTGPDNNPLPHENALYDKPQRSVYPLSLNPLRHRSHERRCHGR